MSNKTYQLDKHGSKVKQLLNKIDVLSKDDIGLDQVNNTSDADKPVSTLQRQALNDILETAKAYTDKEIAEFDFIKIVSSLPEIGLPNRIYLVPKTESEENNLFDEYLWVNNSWEWIATKSFDIDLTEYATKEEVDEIASSAKSAVQTAYTAAQMVDGVRNEVEQKQDALTEEQINDINSIGNIETMAYTAAQMVDGVRNAVERKQDKLTEEQINDINDIPNIRQEMESVSSGEYELIEKIVVGYSITTAEPDDWSENYTLYFKNTGTLKEPIYTALTEFEEWKVGEYYNYTEPTGQYPINITTEPNGTGFSFSKLYIHWTDNKAYGSNGSGAFTVSTTDTFTITKDQTSVFGNGMHITNLASTSINSHVVVCEINNGLLEMRNYYGNGGTLANSNVLTLTKPNEVITAIRIRGTGTYHLMGDTEIYIYGVRA